MQTDDFTLLPCKQTVLPKKNAGFRKKQSLKTQKKAFQVVIPVPDVAENLLFKNKYLRLSSRMSLTRTIPLPSPATLSTIVGFFGVGNSKTGLSSFFING
tara:strand:- start:197 stop:496 length:300 start_codon:yes stop_codon:yes gene_type:complete